MKILALDSSQIQAAVAVIENGKITSSAVGSTSVATSSALLPLVDQVLRAARIKISDVDAFAVGVGPGSFTGLRIGCATIKALAQVEKKPVLAFSSLYALAASANSNKPETIIAMVNAYQGLVFVGRQQNGKWSEEAARPETIAGDTIHRGQITPEGLAVAALQGRQMTYLELQANYIRPSQAEINLTNAGLRPR